MVSGCPNLVYKCFFISKFIFKKLAIFDKEIECTSFPNRFQHLNVKYCIIDRIIAVINFIFQMSTIRVVYIHLLSVSAVSCVIFVYFEDLMSTIYKDHFYLPEVDNRGN